MEMVTLPMQNGVRKVIILKNASLNSKTSKIEDLATPCCIGSVQRVSYTTGIMDDICLQKSIEYRSGHGMRLMR